MQVNVEYLDQDVASKSQFQKSVTSSEDFQKLTDQWSISAGFNIEAMVGGFGGGVGLTAEYSEMNSEEIKKTNYQSEEKSSEKRYSPDSRQLIRQEVKKITFEYNVGKDKSFAEAKYESEKHVGSIDKRRCPNPDPDYLSKRAITYINETYGRGGGTINGRTYSETKCKNAGK